MSEKSLGGILHLLLGRPSEPASGQAYGTSRETFFTGTREMLYKHVCPPTDEGLPDLVPVDPVGPADRVFDLSLMSRYNLALPDEVAAMVGDDELPMWVIRNDLAGGVTYPSSTLRMIQGEMIHAHVTTASDTHTIHWHGIEPTPMNDGVGKHSFEIIKPEGFTYQFQPNEAGTYFYHCHKNTTLHFEMGLFGALIVDPPAPPGSGGVTAPYNIGGPGYVAGRLTTDPPETSLIRYDVERIWVADDMDSRWHLPELHHNHNMQACNPDDPANPNTFHVFGSTELDLNDFRPDIFAVSGAVLNVGAQNPQGVYEGVLADAGTKIYAEVNQTILLRFLNASYTVQELTLPVNATVIAWDGHPLGVGGFHRFSAPYVVPAGRPIRISTARRMDIILDSSVPVNALAHIRYYDWIRGVPGGLVADVGIPVFIFIA